MVQTVITDTVPRRTVESTLAKFNARICLLVRNELAEVISGVRRTNPWRRAKPVPIKLII